MSEVKNERKEIFSLTIDEETKENFGGYLVYSQLLKQINLRLGEE
ncbi:6043_t:CDS:1, partial [Cetraspora pellucida]